MTIRPHQAASALPIRAATPAPARPAGSVSRALILGLALLSGAVATAADIEQTSHIDLQGMDTSVRPGDDFYRYANGAWLDRTSIPPDRTEVGVFSQLREKVLQRERDILEAQARDPSSNLGAFYASFLDERTLDAKGLSPILPALRRIADARGGAALLRVMARLQQRGVDGLIHFDVSIDDGHPTAYAVMLRQTPLGLPSATYYRSSESRMVAVRAAYLDYLERLLTLAGQDHPRARAQAVLTLNADFAAVELDRAAAFDATTSYHPMSVTQLAQRAPGIDWPAYLEAMQLGSAATLVVRQPVPVAAIVRRWAQAPLALQKDWLLLQTLDHYAEYLSRPFAEAQFAFYGTALQGTNEQPARWQRGVSLVAWRMRDTLGKAYVERYFPPASRTAAVRLAQSILDTFRLRIREGSWMAPATRTEALRKLDSVRPLIGYPDHWRDDGRLRIVSDDLVGNIDRAEELDYRRERSRLGRPVDRDEWMLPPTVTVGWSNPVARIVAFPAALLQPPLFDPDADAAINYGAIGVVMGHEFSHLLDNNGRRYDADGRLSDWWSAEDSARYEAQADRLVQQYDSYEPLPGLHASGRLTLSENIADLGGMAASHEAYRQSLQGRDASVLDGLTGEQRFFLSYAQMSRDAMREDAIRRLVLSDEHSIDPLRVQTMRNLDAWYAAFAVMPGDKLYLAPQDRVTIW